MAFMGIMSAICVIINVILAVTDVFFIGLSLFIALILPLASVIVELTCKDKYYPIFFVATIGLSLVATLWNIHTTILYLIPSLITGYFFGLSAKYKFSPVYSIIIGAIAQALLTYLTIPLINLIFGIDIINTFLVFFQLQNSSTITIIIPSVILLLSLIQMTLSYLIISSEINKFGYEYQNELKIIWPICATTMFFSILIIPFYFASLSVAYIFLIISIYFAVALVVNISYRKMWKTLIFSTLSVIIAAICYVFLYKFLAFGSGLLLYGIAPLLISIIILVSSFLKKTTDK